jgi:probable O-glycosylation ligase (exosortase A-associated)
MRDILITVVIVGLLPFILRSPRLGAYVWAWLSMMIPHRAAWGFARTLPFAQAVALATLAGLLFTKERRPFPVNGITKTQLLFLVWMSVTSIFALANPEIVLDQWLMVLKIHLMLFVTMMLIRERVQIERLIWVVTLSIGFYGLKGGIWTVLTGGGGRVWGPSGGMLEGNNELGLALVLLVPFMYYLYQVSTRRSVRSGLVLFIVFNAFAILGTQSRGALVGLVAMAFALGLKGKRPIRTSLLIVGLLTAAVTFMPESWSGRMHTIHDFEQDTSAMSRVYTWQTMWNAAVDRPLVGVGFGADNPVVFSRYAPVGGVGAYTAGGIFVAHSIYFQALGEHGFPGLILYLLLGIMSWRTAGRLARETSEDPEFASWVPLLMRMAQVSLAGFAVGGAFLSLVHFDLPYYVIGFVVLVETTLRERSKPAAVGVAPILR